MTDLRHAAATEEARTLCAFERTDPKHMMTAPPTAEDAEGLATEGQPGPVALTAEAGLILLHLARLVVISTASRRLREMDASRFLPRDPPFEVLAPTAAFVTLYRGGEVRGCVGSLDSGLPLWENVVSAAVGAAARDWRFLPIAEREVPSLSINISVLGPTVPLEDLSRFRPGLDGLIVERGGRRGLLLPEVASDEGWGVTEMVEATCQKAGLPTDAWRDKRTNLLVFRTARVSDAPSNGAT